VVDWINLPHFPWTFNIADSAITCAAVLIALLALRNVPLDGGIAPADPAAPAAEADSASKRGRPAG
jgi:signal peptidase II